jgi:biotin synthase-like enzyme
MENYFKIIVLAVLTGFCVTGKSFGQTNSLIAIIDSITINELNHCQDTIQKEIEDKQPIIIIDGIAVKRSQLLHIDIKDIRKITTVSDTIASKMFDNGLYGIIIINTKLSKRKLEKKL